MKRRYGIAAAIALFATVFCGGSSAERLLAGREEKR